MQVFHAKVEKSSVNIRRALLVLSAVIFVIVSCNSPEAQADKASADTSTQAISSKPHDTTAASLGIAAFDPKLNIVTMEGRKFRDLVPNNGKKVVVKHAITAANPGGFTLTLWREESNKKYEVPPEYFTVYKSGTVELGAVPALFGDLKLSKNQAKDIKDRIPNGSQRFVVFVPRLDPLTFENRSHSVVYYDVHIVSNLSQIDTDILTVPLTGQKRHFLFSINPSPPASASEETDD